VSLKVLRALIMLPTFNSLSPTIWTFYDFPSPTTVTSSLKKTKPIFLWGSIFLNYWIWDSIALSTHCFLEMNVLFLLWAPGKKLNWASSPGSINCFNISISYWDIPNFRSTLPAISLVLFMLPERSTQKIIV